MEKKENFPPFRCVLEGGCGEIVEKKSRFLATVRPVETEEEASAFIEEMKKKYWDATHNCSAFVIGRRGEITRCSDDGEPSGTAGRPMLEVLLKEGICNTAVVVTRYFGGVLLGTGGLVRAYSHAAKLAVTAGGIVTMGPCSILNVETDYAFYQRLLTILPEFGATVQNSDFSDKVTLTLSVASEKEALICDKIFDCSDGRVKAQKIGENFAEI